MQLHRLYLFLVSLNKQLQQKHSKFYRERLLAIKYVLDLSGPLFSGIYCAQVLLSWMRAAIYINHDQRMTMGMDFQLYLQYQTACAKQVHQTNRSICDCKSAHRQRTTMSRSLHMADVRCARAAVHATNVRYLLAILVLLTCQRQPWLFVNVQLAV